MPKKARGRPPRHAGERLGKNRTFRVRGALDEMLELSAKMSGRSVSEEIERRLEQTFRDEADAGGPALVKINRLMTSAFAVAGEMASGGKPPEEWIRDPVVYWFGARAVFKALRSGLEGTTPPADDLDMVVDLFKETQHQKQQEQAPQAEQPRRKA
jgi:hypothetical protein